MTILRKWQNRINCKFSSFLLLNVESYSLRRTEILKINLYEIGAHFFKGRFNFKSVVLVKVKSKFQPSYYPTRFRTQTVKRDFEALLCINQGMSNNNK